MNSMKLVNPLHLIVLVNSHQRWKQTRNRVCFHLWCELTMALWCHRIVWSLFFLEIKCNGMMNFMEFMQTSLSNETSLSVDYTNSTGLSFLWYQIKQRKFGDWKSYYFSKSNLEIKFKNEWTSGLNYYTDYTLKTNNFKQLLVWNKQMVV